MKLRNATINDAQDITSTQIKAWKKAHADFIPSHVLNSLSQHERAKRWHEIIEKIAANNEIVVAESNNQLVGFIHAVFESREDTELVRLYVLPEYWNQGVASTLLKEVLSRFKYKCASKMIVWTAEESVSARQFYERKGFKIIPNRTRIDCFTIDGTLPDVLNMNQEYLDREKGEFREVCYEMYF